MKKLIALTVALLVLALIGTCVAEEQTEIEGRVLREGKYIIGEDIEAGTYTLTCTATAGEQMNDTWQITIVSESIFSSFARMTCSRSEANTMKVR